MKTMNNKSAPSDRARIALLNKTMEVIKSGFAGVLSNGNIVDRREYPDAMPIPANPMFNTPEPKQIKNGKSI